MPLDVQLAQAIEAAVEQATGVGRRAHVQGSLLPKVDEAYLRKRWLWARQEVEYAMDRGEIPGSGFVFDPRLGTLQDVILAAWGHLGELSVITQCLGIIERMHANVGAALLGYESLRVALGLAGETVWAVAIADQEAAYLEAHKVQLRRSPAYGAEPTEGWSSREDRCSQ